MDGTSNTRTYRPVRRAAKLFPKKASVSTSTAGPADAASHGNSEKSKPNVLTGRITFKTNYFAPPPSSGDPDFLLLDDAKTKDIVLTIPLPPPASKRDTVQIMLNGVLVGAPVPVDEFIPLDEMTLTLTAADREAQPDGRVSINYHMAYLSGGSKTEDGPPDQFYTTDKTIPGEPGFLGQLVFSPLVMEDGITPAALEDDGAGGEYIAATVPSFSNGGRDFVIHGLIGPKEEELNAVENPDGGYDVRFLRTFIEENEDGDGDGKPDGQLDFSYLIKKRTGLQSPPALARTVGVFLQDAFNPATPKVPAYDDDADPKLIDVADARVVGGLTVEIPGDANYVAGDEIWVQWGGDEIGPSRIVDVGANPVAIIGIPFAAVLASWLDATSGADIEQTVSVNYEVRRGSMVAGTPLTPASVAVNLHEAGGKDPDPETPENENLTKPLLRSDSGSENDIPPGDVSKDAKVFVPWTLKDPAGASAFQIDDQLVGQYNGLPFAPTPILAVPTQDIELILPHDMIGKQGSGPKTLSYAIFRPLALGGTNTSLSPPQQVVVHGSDELPGGGKPLAAGRMPEAIGTDTEDPDRLMIGKDEAASDDGSDFIIDPYINQQIGDKIVVTLTAFRFFYIDGAHPDDKYPQPNRTVISKTIKVESTDQPTTHHFSREDLMKAKEPTMPLHAHVQYNITGLTTPDRSVDSEILVIDVDPRGDD